MVPSPDAAAAGAAGGKATYRLCKRAPSRRPYGYGTVDLTADAFGLCGVGGR